MSKYKSNKINLNQFKIKNDQYVPPSKKPEIKQPEIKQPEIIQSGIKQYEIRQSGIKQYEKEQNHRDGNTNISDDIPNMEMNETENLELKLLTSFEELGLKENLLRGIYSYGFEVPSRIQSYAIPYMIKRQDMIAQSQSGTGKTGAFAIGILNIIDETNKHPQALIVCNTHELAVQIHSVINELGRYLEVNVALLIGGVSILKNIEDAKSCQVMVGTPGRIRDLVERGGFDTNLIRVLVIDEADELLRDEFLDQTKYIIMQMPQKTQICIYSATMPKETLDVTHNFMTNPVKILVEREKLSLDLITQYYVNVIQEQNKFETLEDLYGKLSINQCIIYVNSINKAESLKDQLIKHMHVAEMIHSKLDNKSRMDIMARFRKGEFRVLISTDLICRGIDIQHINYVINYDLPYNPQSYLHRIGRSGRFGKKGVAINFVTQRDFHILKSIERYYTIRIGALPDPSVINSIV